MITLKTALVITATFSTPALAAAGPSTGGGGDVACEDKIKIIRDDIIQWIAEGGSDHLDLTAPLTSKIYSDRMVAVLNATTKIQCVGLGDPSFPVEFHGTPKVCRFERLGDLQEITCDFNKFAEMTGSDQYVQIHHEFAGLAGLENPNNDDSNYGISNQIVSSTSESTSTKLVVKDDSPSGLEGEYQVTNSALSPFGPCLKPSLSIEYNFSNRQLLLYQSAPNPIYFCLSDSHSDFPSCSAENASYANGELTITQGSATEIYRKVSDGLDLLVSLDPNKQPQLACKAKLVKKFTIPDNPIHALRAVVMEL